MILDSNLSVQTVRLKTCGHFSWVVKEKEVLIYFCKFPSPLLFLGWEGCFTTGEDTKQPCRAGNNKKLRKLSQVPPSGKILSE